MDRRVEKDTTSVMELLRVKLVTTLMHAITTTLLPSLLASSTSHDAWKLLTSLQSLYHIVPTSGKLTTMHRRARNADVRGG